MKLKSLNIFRKNYLNNFLMLIYGNNIFHQQVNRHGAEAARRAHNPEVTGSKPVAGIQNFRLL